MKSKVRAIYKVTFLEFLRDRVVWVAVFTAGFMFVLNQLLGVLSLYEQQKILADFGWATVLLATVVVGILLGSHWLKREIEQQTCHLVLSRPISRDQFLVAKFLALCSLLTILQVILTLCLSVFLRFAYSFSAIFSVLWGCLLVSILITAISFCAAIFVRPTIATMWGLSAFIVGHWMQEIEFFGRKVNDQFYVVVAETAKWIFPNLYQMNFRNVYFLEHGVQVSQMLWVTFHGLGWILFLVTVSIFLFRRKDLV